MLRQLSLLRVTFICVIASIAVLAAGRISAPADAGFPIITFTVTTNGDESDDLPGDGVCDVGSIFGPECTLRAAIEEVNGGEWTFSVINFAITGSPAITVSPLLPTIVYPVEIDGTTQCATPPCVVVQPGARVIGDGLVVAGGSSTVKGMIIRGFSGAGIRLQTEPGDVVSGNYIGVAPDGFTIGANGTGVVVEVADNVIGGTTTADRNVISGNTGHGVYILGANTNRVAGNYIGTASTGQGDVGNGADGVRVGGDGNTVGGAGGTSMNVISGNGENGVTIMGSSNVVRENRIGISVSGAFDTGNSANGVHVVSGTGNTIGYTTGSGSFQDIRGNDGNGVLIEGTSSGTTVSTNIIGRTGVNSTIANNLNGIHLRGGTQGNMLGSGNYTNQISGNGLNGILIEGATTINNVVDSSLIGTDGTNDLGNTGHGILFSGTGVNTVKSSNPVFRTVISGNGGSGVRIEFSNGVKVGGSLIGTTSDGLTSIPNALGGVYINFSTDADIGGITTQDRNIISGNTAAGILMFGSTTSGALIRGNYIGTNINGTAALGNSTGGIDIRIDAQNSTIGGTTSADRNVISGNNGRGISIVQAVSGHVVQGNYIGTNAAGTAAIPNAEGITIGNTIGSNTIGGSVAGAGNLISGNSFTGLYLLGSNNLIRGNKIGTDAAGTAALPNLYGVYIFGSAGMGANNAFGGFGGLAANTIAFNSADGIRIDGATAIQNPIRFGSIHSNGFAGIDNISGGNTELAPPVIVAVTATTVIGTACASCIIDVFADASTEGQTFRGSTNTDGTGYWELNVPFLGPNVTATATDSNNNTSEFGVAAADGDGDGVLLPNDNCATTANPSQTNTDAAPYVTTGAPNDVTIANSDIYGDACDTDDDNDGTTDAAEVVACLAFGATNALLLDTDGDHVMDRAECLLGTDPNNALSKPPAIPAGDTDQDGLPSALETAIGSNPAVPDTDGDGINDGVEFRGYNSSPTNQDTDGDLCRDDKEIPSVDGNTVVNSLDLLIIALRFNATDRPYQDINKNGIVNSIDLSLAAVNFDPAPC